MLRATYARLAYRPVHDFSYLTDDRVRTYVPRSRAFERMSTLRHLLPHAGCAQG
jgi:hypothetical protein